MEQIADDDLPPRHRLSNGPRCPIRRRRSAARSTRLRAGLLLVYLVLAGQYESWIAPLSVILAVPLALLGPVAC
jgi:HAE1 family hydrophobic/amphiphilic exporter-1